MTRPAPATWRSLMFVPATGGRFVAKAHSRGADVVILDLEDSIPPREKQAARDALPAAAATVGQAGARSRAHQPPARLASPTSPPP